KAVNDFNENKKSITQLVNDKLVNRKDIDELIGHNYLDKIFEYHEYHVQLMTQIFRTNNFTLLFNSIPRVYKKYKQLGFSYTYFQEDLKTWIPVNDNLLKPDNALSINEVYSSILENHYNFVDLVQKIK
ncbi:MAG: hypothetical protein ACOCRB_02710, partial [Halanaerobiaceae bacterium]